jgi:hypothetical protein
MARQHHRGRGQRTGKGKIMTRETEKLLRQLIDHPPEGSPTSEAKQFGVDLYSLLENLKLTPPERLRRAAGETAFVERLRRNLRTARL